MKQTSGSKEFRSVGNIFTGARLIDIVIVLFIFSECMSFMQILWLLAVIFQNVHTSL
jgi:hypothetical protein